MSAKPNLCAACGAPVVEREIDHYPRSVCTSCNKIHKNLRRGPPTLGGGGMRSVQRIERPFAMWYNDGKAQSPSPGGNGCTFTPESCRFGRRTRRPVKGSRCDALPSFIVLRCGAVGCPSVTPEARLALPSAVSVRASCRVHATVTDYRNPVPAAGDDAAEVAFFTADALPPPEQVGFATHRRALQEWGDQLHYGILPPRVQRSRALYLAGRRWVREGGEG